METFDVRKFRLRTESLGLLIATGSLTIAASDELLSKTTLWLDDPTACGGASDSDIRSIAYKSRSIA